MPENGIPVALLPSMTDDRVARRNGKVNSRRKVEAAREIEPKALAREGRARRTDRNKPERRRNYRFRESLG